MNDMKREKSGWWAGITAVVVAAAAAVSGCESTSSFSDIPEISFLRIAQRDSAFAGGSVRSMVDVTISWTDGNGDLGFLPDTALGLERNYFIKIEKKKAGVFRLVTPPATGGFDGRFKNLNPDGEGSTKPYKLRGELKYRINGTGFLVVIPQTLGTIDGVSELSRQGDVLRFKIQIKDRAGNLSNEITTEEVTL